MKRKKSQLKICMLIGIVACSLLVGCASGRINQFKSFAEAGTAYSDAVVALTEQSGKIAIDADSLILMKGRTRLSPEARGKKIITHNNLLKERMEILGKLRRHAQLLRSYFVSLAALANSDAPSGIGTSIEEAVKALGGLSKEIKQAKVGEVPIANFVGDVTKIVVAKFQNKALKKELKLRAKDIERELDLQHAAFEAMAEQIRTDLKIVLNRQEALEVVDPYKDPRDTLPRDWKERRREILTTTLSSSAIDAAADAAKNLKAAFVSLVENRFTAVDYQALIKDVGEIISLIERVQGAREK
jgi:hypothetical protein